VIVDFLVTKHGLAEVLRSDDAAFQALHAYFFDRLVPVCEFLGTPGKVWHTTDGGRSWSLSFAEPAPSGTVHPPAADISVLECAGGNAAWVLFLVRPRSRWPPPAAPN
jgi:hypothetical protein